jgi:hypothetical protein
MTTKILVALASVGLDCILKTAQNVGSGYFIIYGAILQQINDFMVKEMERGGEIMIFVLILHLKSFKTALLWCIFAPNFKKTILLCLNKTVK